MCSGYSITFIGAMLLIIFHCCVCDKIAYNFCKYPVFVSYGVECSHYYLSLQSVMEVWKETHWREINVDQMDAELKRFAKVRGSAFAFIIINNVYFVRETMRWPCRKIR